MKYGYTAEVMQAAERPELEAGRGEHLMRTAAAGLASMVIRALRERRGTKRPGTQAQVAGARIVCLVGSGNNGGDALFAAATLARRGAYVSVIDTLGQMHAEGARAARNAGCRVLNMTTQTNIGDAVQLTSKADLIIDGIFGIGARPGLPEHIAVFLNACIDHGVMPRCARERVGAAAAQTSATTEGTAGVEEAMRFASGFPQIIAVDVPTGVDATTGACNTPHIRATHTVTFGGYKTGLLLPGGAQAAGEVTVVPLPIRLGDECDGDNAPYTATVIGLSAADLTDLIPRPQPHHHKYSRGVLGLVAGSAQFPGAGVLAARGGVACGTGMIRLYAPEEVVNPVHTVAPEVVSEVCAPAEEYSDYGQNEDHVAALPGAGKETAWAIGAGAPARSVLQGAIRQATRTGAPVIWDAAALELISGEVPTASILTPHAGELAALLSRLTGLHIRPSQIAENPVRFALRGAEMTGAVVLLKGSQTVVAEPHGVVWTMDPAPPSLATAGTGDVLLGIIGGLLAQYAADRQHHMSDARDVSYGDADTGALPLGKIAAAAALLHAEAARKGAAGVSMASNGAGRAGMVSASDLPGAVADIVSTVWGSAWNL